MSLKDQKKSKKIQEKNKSYKTKIRHQRNAIEKNLKSHNGIDLLAIKDMVAAAQQTLDKAVNKKVIHKNKAARRKRKLFKLLQKSS